MPPFTPGRAFLWMLTSFLLMIFFAVFYMVIDQDAQQDLVALGIVSCASFLLMSALLIGRYPGGPRLGQPLGIRPSHPGAILLGFAVGLAAKIPAEQVSLWVHQAFPRSEAEEKAYEAMFQAESPVHAAAMLIVIAVLVPFAEEVFFRGAVYGALRRNRVSELRAAVVTAVGFSLVHADLRQMLPIFLVAGLLSALRAYSGSLLPGFAAHMGFNAVAVLGATYGLLPDVEEVSDLNRVASLVALLILLSILVTVVGKHPRAREAREQEMLVATEERPGAQE